MTTNRPLRVFLCHSSNDKPVVHELYQKLRAETWIDPWLDEEELLPGHDWNTEIEKAVDQADAVIVFISKNSVTKEGYIQKELKKILDKADEKPDEAIFIVPVRLDNCEIPNRLKRKQYVDYFPVVNQKSAYSKILNSLKARRFVVSKTPNSPSRETQATTPGFSSAQSKYYRTASDISTEKALSFSNLPELKTGLKLGFIGLACALILEIITEWVFLTGNYFLLLIGLLFGFASSFFSLRFGQPASRKQSIVIGVVSSAICGIVISVLYAVIYILLDNLSILYLSSDNIAYSIGGFVLAVVGGLGGSYLYALSRNF